MRTLQTHRQRWIGLSPCLVVTTVFACCSVVLAGAGPVVSDSPVASDAASSATERPTLPGRVVMPKLGYRYASLTRRETRALRRDFRLPMEALSVARTPADLRKSAKVAPLPDPSKPFLPVKKATAGSGNPFGGERLTAFRDNPMKALGERLGVVDGGGDAAPLDTADNPFGVALDSGSAGSGNSGGDDPFSTNDSEPAPEPEDDPFDF